VSNRFMLRAGMFVILGGLSRITGNLEVNSLIRSI
jgi:hypothetical protein